MAASYQEKGEDIQFHIDKMKEILYATQTTLQIALSMCITYFEGQ